MGKLILAGVKVHLASAIEQDLDGPLTKEAAGFPQEHLGRLPAIEKLHELLWDLLFSERVFLDGDEELEEYFMEALCFLVHM
jgi:hypothetical protein